MGRTAVRIDLEAKADIAPIFFFFLASAEFLLTDGLGSQGHKEKKKHSRI